MREGTRLWKQMNNRVLTLLNELDPYGLEPGKPDGAPPDEYDLEAVPIARHLMKDGSINLDKVDEIWNYWFDQTLTEAVGRTAAEQLIDNLNTLTASTTELRDAP